jgi:archaellum biogenesis protein FlaJ (TadC family)
VLTVANTFAPYAASGGHIYKLCLYGAVMTFLSGVSMLVVPAIVHAIFASVASPL